VDSLGDEKDKPSGARSSPDAGASAPGTVRVKQDKLRIEVSLEDIPEPVSGLLQKLAKPHSESRFHGFVKDYSTLLTPILTAIIAGIVSFFAYKFDDHVSRDTLDKITTEFVQGNTDPNVTAMRLAAYGDKALPAVKIALGTRNPMLRKGAVQIAAQMYFAETVRRDSLTKSMLEFYDNPVLRLGVLEWFSTIESSPVPLSDKYREAVFRKLQDTFNFDKDPKSCEVQGADLAGAVATLLAVGPLANRKDFLLAMDKSCPKDFSGVHATLKGVL
jgi:hypothetical protein